MDEKLRKIAFPQNHTRIVISTLLCFAMLWFLSGVLFFPWLLSLLDPAPPLSEAMVLSSKRGQLLSFLCSTLFMLAAGLAWKTRWGHAFFTRSGVMNSILVFGALLPFAVYEIALQPRIQEANKSTIFEYDTQVGWRLKPHAKGYFANASVQINGKGIRGTDVPYTKPDSVYRILFLGDSVTFGHAVEEDTSIFPHRTGIHLSRSLSKPVQTINSGVPGYMLWQELAYLEKEGIRYEPDLVVVGIVLNDVAEYLDYAFWQNDKLRSLTAFSWIDRMAHRSALVWTAQAIGLRLRVDEIDLAAKQVHDVQRLVKQPDDAAIQDAWTTALTTLDQLVVFCRVRHLPILLVVFPYTFQLDNPLESDRPQQQIEAYALQNDLPFLDLLPLLAAETHMVSLTPDSLFIDYDHLSTMGHDIVAQHISAFIMGHNVLGRPE